MPTQKNLETIISDTKKYLDTKLEYIRLSLVEKAAKFFASMASNLFLALFFLLFVLFASVTFAFYLSQLFGSYTLGFATVTLLYLLKFVVLLCFKGKFIEKRLTDFFIKVYFNKIENKEDEK